MYALSEYLKQMNSILPKQSEMEIQPLDEGFSNKTYQIRWRHQPQIVLRIPQLDEQAFGVDREVELQVWKMAASQGISSNVLWHDAKGAVASEFIKGETLSWDVQHSQEDTQLQAICLAVKSLHRLPPIAKHYDVYCLIESWLTNIAKYPNVKVVQLLVNQMNVLFASLKRVRPKTFVLCHNDLNPKNMILNGQRAWLIDWECAGMNDPLFDLAVLSHCHHLNDAQIDHAFEVIFGEQPTDLALENITHYRKAYVIRELVWLLLKHLTHGSQDLDCLQWYHALLSDPMFNPYFKTE